MRKTMSFSLSVDVLEALKKLSEETMIPQARIVEKGIKEILQRDIDNALNNLPPKEYKKC